MNSLRLGLSVLLALTGAARAAPPVPAAPAVPVNIPGSSAFCLYETPSDDGNKRRWINLGIVQYLELTASDLKIFYGGGAFGGGYEIRIPVANADDAMNVLEKLRKAAAACR